MTAIKRGLAGLLALGGAANGIWMIADPWNWYGTIPGVSETGAYNPHFVRDIGCAFLVSAIGFAWSAVASGARVRHAAPAVIGALFIATHALIHVWDLIAGRENMHHFMDDAAAIFLPAIVAAYVVWPASSKTKTTSKSRARSRDGWFAKLMAPKLQSFEREFGYDTKYMQDVARISPKGFLRFGLFTVFANHREDTPVDAWFAAKLVAAMREDCGPCTQLVVKMAERAYGANEEGDAPVDAKTLRAILEGDDDAMSPAASLAYRFANAVLDRDLVRADALRNEIVEVWGERALVTLSFTVAASRIYPTMKYGLGHGRACSRVSVGDEVVTVAGAHA